MTIGLDPGIEPEGDRGPAPPRPRVTLASVVTRRIVAALLVLVPLAWSLQRALPADSDVVNVGGLSLLGRLLGSVLHPALDPTFLAVVVDASVITVVYAALGTAGALVVGVVGGLILSDVAWGRTPILPLRLLRWMLRALLVAARSIHELVWALLFVSTLGLDPLVAVLAIAIPFGAQTAKVFSEILDSSPRGPIDLLRTSGSKPIPAFVYGLLPGSAPMLTSYSFYRFECAIRSAVVLGVVGVGGLGQELVVSLQSRNWDEVWTLIGAVIVISAVVDVWSAKLRGDLAVVSCSDWSGGTTTGDRRSHGSRWAQWTAAAALPGLAVAWWASGVSWSGLTSARTRDLTVRLLDDMWPPALPPQGWGALFGGVADTVAMAVLAMAIAVGVTLLVGPWAMHRRPDGGRAPDAGRSGLGRWGFDRSARLAAYGLARLILLVLRSVPPTVWAVVALFALFPGVLPGALALGLYTGGILGRLVAEAWESLDARPRDALQRAGVRPGLASLAATAPPSLQHVVTYTMYRFEICVRDTAIVGVVGAAGLGRLLAESLATFRFPVVSTLLVASLAVSLAAEVVSRWVRRWLQG